MQNKQSIQIYETKLANQPLVKPSLSKQTKPNKSNSPNQIYQTKPTKPNLPN